MKSSPKATSSNGRHGPATSGSSDEGSAAPTFGEGTRSVAPGAVEEGASADLQKVRDLLFGSQAKQHEDALREQSSKQAAQMERLETHFAERLSALEEEFKARLKTAESELRDEVRAEVAAIVARMDDEGARKVERSDLKSLLNDLAGRLGD